MVSFPNATCGTANTYWDDVAYLTRVVCWINTEHQSIIYHHMCHRISLYTHLHFHFHFYASRLAPRLFGGRENPIHKHNSHTRSYLCTCRRLLVLSAPTSRSALVCPRTLDKMIGHPKMVSPKRDDTPPGGRCSQPENGCENRPMGKKPCITFENANSWITCNYYRYECMKLT